MDFYRDVLRSLLFAFSNKDAEVAHNMAMFSLRSISNVPLLARGLESFFSVDTEGLEQDVFGLHFNHPLGLAAGFDKNGLAVWALQALGFSYVEVGTVTRYAQAGNARPRIFRLNQDQALINRMGFNNRGADALAVRLKRLKDVRIPVGVSLGKSKITPLEEAASDYLYSLEVLYPYGDYFVVNVSSPNTPGLRQLQEKRYLSDLLGVLMDKAQVLSKTDSEHGGKVGISNKADRKRKPILVKVAPDLEFSALDDLLEVCLEKGVDGLIATNTTLGREGLKTAISEEGGLSGRPLFSRMLSFVKYIASHTERRLPIVGVGGIFEAEQAYEVLKAGACLLQAYTGFVFNGPFFVKKLVSGLKDLMKRDGVRNIAELRSS